MTALRPQLAQARVLVIGCGATGVSAARFAAGFGARVRVLDSRGKPPGASALARACPAAELLAGGLDVAALDGVDRVLVSPGVDLREPIIAAARDAGHAIVGDIEWFARSARAPIVAITGSNGKSTVTAWLAEIARAAGLDAAVGGNFGTPALDLLAARPDLYVLELSSFQLELTRRLPALAAAVLNVSADHIDRHGDIDAYAALKARVFAHAKTAVVNADDPRVAAMDTRGARVRRFGRNAGADYRLLEDARGPALARQDRAWLAGDALGLAGAHNQINALAVWALAEAIGLDEAVIRGGLCRFQGLPHRCQVVAEIAGVRWIDDSKGTNLGALMASLAGTVAPVILLAGGQAKGADFAPLGPLAAAKAKAVIVFGQDGPAIAAAVRAYVAVYAVATLLAAVAKAAALAQRGDTVLLSPGCASFDQFAHFAQRGDAFAAAVRELGP